MANDVFIHTTNWKNQKPPLGSELNRSHPLAQGLVGAWLMNEGGGSVVRDLVGLHHGVVGGLTVLPIWINTTKGTGIRYNIDYAQYINLGSAPIISSLKNSSIELILSATGVTWSSGRPIYCERNSSTPIWKLQRQENGGALQFVHRDDAGTLTFANPGIYDLTVGGLNHIIMTKSGTRLDFYWNGKWYVAATLNGTDTLTAGDARIGLDSQDIASHYSGDIVLIRLYNRTLSPQEIQSLYEAPYQFIRPITRRFFSSGGTSTPVTSVYRYVPHLTLMGCG